jgi:hypothetical protein
MPSTALIICRVAECAGMNQVLGAMGQGYGGLEQGLGISLAATSDNTVETHRMMNHAQASDSLGVHLTAMASNQDLPPISPNLWGVSNTISAEDAQTAMLGLSVFIFAGAMEGLDPTEQAAQLNAWRALCLAGMDLTHMPPPPDN